MNPKDQLKDIPIDQVAESLEKIWKIFERNLQAFFDEGTQGEGR
jgi:hypothetical protein